MEDIRTTLKTTAGKHGTLLIAALDRAEIADWQSIDSTESVCRIRECIEDMSNSGSVYSAKLASIIGRYEDQLPSLPKGWRKSLAIKQSASQQTFLSMDDIHKMFEFNPRNENERFIMISAIIELRTGTRISDTKNLDERNEVEGMLCYISQKTKTEAFLPSSPELLHLLKIRRSMGIAEYTDEGYNKALRRILGDAGITQEVKLYRRGEYREEEKCDAMASHSLRRTFCTQLHLSGEDLADIMGWAGHKNISTTIRYIRAHRKPGAPRWNFFEVLDRLIADKFPMTNLGATAISGAKQSAI